MIGFIVQNLELVTTRIIGRIIQKPSGPSRKLAEVWIISYMRMTLSMSRTLIGQIQACFPLVMTIWKIWKRCLSGELNFTCEL